MDIKLKRACLIAGTHHDVDDVAKNVTEKEAMFLIDRCYAERLSVKNKDKRAR